MVRRIGWFIVIWLASVLTLGGIAALLRTVMKLAGLSG
ncbi:MAG TPA: DUF2474 domain-containing protein [Acetobacteraceae bacterium]|jgi:hypothetical protein